MFRAILYIILAIISIFISPRSYGRRYRMRSYYRDYNSAGGLIEDYIRRRNSRINALRNASSFIKPYKKLFGNHVLSNKHCSISLDAKQSQIICLSNEYNVEGKKMMLYANGFQEVSIDEYFDMMCGVFNYNTSYRDVVLSLRTAAIISEYAYNTKPVDNQNEIPNQKIEQNAYSNTNYDVLDVTTKENGINDSDKIDINNASEAELTALPGINVIMAKKIITYRDTNRPFKSVEDFFEIMKIKPHFKERLSKMICTNKVNIRKFKKAKRERIIDI